jgi:hypothetical protein
VSDLKDLLADMGWWDRWLPRLNELLGRGLCREPQYGGRPGFAMGHPEPVVDNRGYSDVLTFFFPTVGDISWRSPGYPHAVAAAGADSAHEGCRATARPEVWDPVLRHVALALCALESTAQSGTDLQLRLEVEARLTGSWVQVLNNLIGKEPATQLAGPIRSV